ncbi:MAG TPA: response regulator, partial [Gaiellaceae bacterium]|nr:response regulator [Gaiellaceae bacterium]
LVADDDPALRMLCSVNLGFDGYRVVEATSAREIDEALEHEPVSLILLDIHLGADNGLEVARRLRETHPDLAIAFFTGSVRVAGEDESLADGMLPKPFTLEELAEIARRLVPGRPLPRR